MQIYIDADFKCYTALKEGRTALETDFFEGMCAAALEAQNDELVEAMAAMVEDVYSQDLAAIEEG